MYLAHDYIMYTQNTHTHTTVVLVGLSLADWTSLVYQNYKSMTGHARLEEVKILLAKQPSAKGLTNNISFQLTLHYSSFQVLPTSRSY